MSNTDTELSAQDLVAQLGGSRCSEEEQHALILRLQKQLKGELSDDDAFINQHSNKTVDDWSRLYKNDPATFESLAWKVAGLQQRYHASSPSGSEVYEIMRKLNDGQTSATREEMRDGAEQSNTEPGPTDLGTANLAAESEAMSDREVHRGAFADSIQPTKPTQMPGGQSADASQFTKGPSAADKSMRSMLGGAWASLFNRK